MTDELAADGHADIGNINVVGAGNEGARRYIVVSYKGVDYFVYQDQASDLFTDWPTDAYQSWFLRGKETKKVFQEAENFENSPIIGGLINYIFDCVFTKKTNVPILNINVDDVVRRCKNVQDFETCLNLGR